MIYLTDYFSIYKKKIKNYLYFYLYLSSRLFIKYCLTDFFLNITKKSYQINNFWWLCLNYFSKILYF